MLPVRANLVVHKLVIRRMTVEKVQIFPRNAVLLGNVGSGGLLFLGLCLQADVDPPIHS